MLTANLITAAITVSSTRWDDRRSVRRALRNQLTTQQLINGVAGTDFMLKGETDELAALVAQQRVVREATIDVIALAAKQPVTEQEIASYYEQNKTIS